MNRIYLRNEITGEEKVLLNQGGYKAPWKVVKVESYKEPGDKGWAVTEETKKREARLAVFAQKMGLPLAEFLDAARWLLQKDCPFCQMATQILKSIDELGEDKAREAIAEILVAKEAKDFDRLEKVKKRLWSSDQHGSPQPS